jgi:hypothetical protein
MENKETPFCNNCGCDYLPYDGEDTGSCSEECDREYNEEMDYDYYRDEETYDSPGYYFNEDGAHQY